MSADFVAASPVRSAIEVEVVSMQGNAFQRQR